MNQPKNWYERKFSSVCVCSCGDFYGGPTTEREKQGRSDEAAWQPKNRRLHSLHYAFSERAHETATVGRKKTVDAIKSVLFHIVDFRPDSLHLGPKSYF